MWGQPIFRQGPRLSFWILELGECNAIYLYLFPLLTTLFCIWANYQLDEKFEPIINSMSICSEHRRLQLPHSRERRTGGELVHRKWTFEASAVYHQQLVQRCNVRRQCKHWWSSSRKWQVRDQPGRLSRYCSYCAVHWINSHNHCGWLSQYYNRHTFQCKVYNTAYSQYYNWHTLQYSYSQQSQHNASQISQLKCIVPSTNWASYYPKKLCSTSYYFTHSVQVASPSQSTTL